MNYRAVAFDYGNVISEAPDVDAIGRLSAIADLDETQMAIYLIDHRGEYDRGTISGNEYFSACLAALEKPVDEGIVAALVRSDLESWANLNEATLALIDDCRQAGLKIAIISNMPHEFLALARKRFPLFTSVDAGIYSCELSVIKPERAIYQALITALKLPPEEIIFFDDLKPNVDGGLAAGLRAELWTSAEAARQKLTDLGLAL